MVESLTVAPREGYREVGDVSVEAGRGAGQIGWYHYAADHIVKGKSVIDIGCGLGNGLEILKTAASVAHGLDRDPRLAGEDITIGDVSSIKENSYEVITCIDVIEHVQDDKTFVSELARIASEAIFITTPNWTASRCQWPYHIREYTPDQLMDLVSPYGEAILYKGNPSGDKVYDVKYPNMYFLLNNLRNWWPTAFVTRCARAIMPDRTRIHSHNALILKL